MSKIIKVSTDLEVTVHDFPQGNMREQNRALYELIGNGCDMIEHVMPVADRRKILLQVCGDADFNEVIESQGDLLRELPESLKMV